MRQYFFTAVYAVTLLLLNNLSEPVQGAIDPFYAGSYTEHDLGFIPGVTTPYGGLTLKFGDPDTLYIGGSANTPGGTMYSIGVTRGAGGHITGFSGVATPVTAAPYNDGGLTYAPGSGGVLFASQWPVNMLSQYLPESADPLAPGPDKVIDLVPLGVVAHAALNFAPASLGGEMKLVSFGGGEFYSATYAPDGFGLFDITSVTYIESLVGGPEGFVYVPTGSALFGTASMLVSEWSAGKVAAYEVDAFGNPILATRKDFLSSFSGAEGAFIDPLTGDFLFSTFGGGDHVVAIRGFAAPEGAVPEPASLIVWGLGMVGCAVAARRRKLV